MCCGVAPGRRSAVSLKLHAHGAAGLSSGASGSPSESPRIPIPIAVVWVENERRGLLSRANAELPIDGGEMALHRGLGHAQLVRDLPVREAEHDHGEDLPLPGRHERSGHRTAKLAWYRDEASAYRSHCRGKAFLCVVGRDKSACSCVESILDRPARRAGRDDDDRRVRKPLVEHLLPSPEAAERLVIDDHDGIGASRDVLAGFRGNPQRLEAEARQKILNSPRRAVVAPRDNGHPELPLPRSSAALDGQGCSHCTNPKQPPVVLTLAVWPV